MATLPLQKNASNSGRRTVALWIILAAQLMLQMDFLIVIVALPHIQQDLGFSPATLSWIPNAFALAFGGLLLFGGRLGDMIGQVRAFRLGLAIFVVASLIGGIAQMPEILIAARVLQGIGAALSGPSVLALVTVIHRLYLLCIHSMDSLTYLLINSFESDDIATARPLRCLLTTPAS